MKWVAVGLLAVLGVVAVGLGIAQRTAWLPDDTVTASVQLDEPGLLVRTAPGVLEARDGPVQVTATGQDGAPVLLAVGREADVVGFAEGLPGTVLTGFAPPAGDALTTEPLAGGSDPGAAAVDPAESDMWVQQESGQGTAALSYDPGPGRWLLLAAGDGTSPAPDELTLTWPQEVVTPWSTPLVVTGVGLLVAAAGAAALVLLLSYRRVTPAQRPVRTTTGSIPAVPAAEPRDDASGQQDRR